VKMANVSLAGGTLTSLLACLAGEIRDAKRRAKRHKAQPQVRTRAFAQKAFVRQLSK